MRTPGFCSIRWLRPLVWSPCRCEMTTASSRVKSMPRLQTLAAKMRPSLPVSNRIRRPPYSTKAAKPQSLVSAEGGPKASYRMVTFFGSCAPAGVHIRAARSHSRPVATLRRYFMPGPPHGWHVNARGSATGPRRVGRGPWPALLRAAAPRCHPYVSPCDRGCARRAAVTRETASSWLRPAGWRAAPAATPRCCRRRGRTARRSAPRA